MGYESYDYYMISRFGEPNVDWKYDNTGKTVSDAYKPFFKQSTEPPTECILGRALTECPPYFKIRGFTIKFSFAANAIILTTI